MRHLEAMLALPCAALVRVGFATLVVAAGCTRPATTVDSPSHASERSAERRGSVRIVRELPGGRPEYGARIWRVLRFAEGRPFLFAAADGEVFDLSSGGEKEVVAGFEKEWFEPAVFEVAKGVYRIPLPMPNDGLTAVNVYAIEDGKGLTMIDGGWSVAASRAALEAALKQLGATPKAITRILVTHIHRDHYTLAVALRKEYGMPSALGIGERDTLEELVGGKTTNLGKQIEMLRGAGAAELADRIAKVDHLIDLSAGWALPDEWLEPGAIDLGNRSVRVLATPGHTRGHIVFVEEESGLLFAGDHVLPKITPSIGFEGRPAPDPLKDFLTSLAKMKALPDLRLLPAHGPVAESTHARVVELVAHHDARLIEMGALLASEKTAFDVANNVGWTRRKRTLDELTPFNQMLAILETQAHLHLLVTSGLATSRVDAGVVLYRTATAA